MMTVGLFQLLLNYYVCDYTASVRAMDFTEVQACMDIYEQVKTEISGLDSKDPATRVDAYILWKAWELQNPDMVEILKQDARRIVDR
jgi:accessory colonization factor AcfC